MDIEKTSVPATSEKGAGQGGKSPQFVGIEVNIGANFGRRPMMKTFDEMKDSLEMA